MKMYGMKIMVFGDEFITIPITYNNLWHITIRLAILQDIQTITKNRE